MKLASLLVFLAITSAFHARAEEEWTRLDAADLPAEWVSFRESIASRPWVVAEFVEKRFFSFRGRPVELTGTVWYGRVEGLTLNYRSPRREVIRVDEKGVRVIQGSGRSRERAIPERGREVPAALLSLFRLDFGELEKNFEVSGRRDGEDWALRLTPHDLKEAALQRIELEGVATEIRRIAIEQSDRRHIELTFSDTVYSPDLDAEERERIFP